MAISLCLQKVDLETNYYNFKGPIYKSFGGGCLVGR